MGRASAVGIATGYRLVGSVIESRWGVRYSVLLQTGPGSHPAPVKWETFLFSGLKIPGRVVDHPSLSSIEVKERV